MSIGDENEEARIAAEYRRQAALCIEVGERMSVTADRLHMLQMAQRWLELAERAERLEVNRE